jgi:hypothetical protein
VLLSSEILLYSLMSGHDCKRGVLKVSVLSISCDVWICLQLTWEKDVVYPSCSEVAGETKQEFEVSRLMNELCPQGNQYLGKRLHLRL